MKQRITSLYALRSIHPLALSLLTAMSLLVVPKALLAQQAATTTATGNSRVISYQGAITASGTPVTGDHLITTTLYSDANGTVAVWSGTYKQRITGGVFSVLLGSGAYPFPASQDFSKPLWIGVKIDGGEELKPLSQLSGAPFAISIPDSSVTQDKMATDYVGSISVDGKQITGKGTALNITDGPGVSVIYDTTSNTLSLASYGGGVGGGKLSPQGLACPWITQGNTFSASCSNIFGFTYTIDSVDPALDILMENHNSTVQMTMLGLTGLGNGLLFPQTTSTGVGVIWQGSVAPYNTYIHSFGGPTNFFAGNQAGNLTMLATTTNNTGIGFQTLTALAGGIHFDSLKGVDSVFDTLGARNTALGTTALATNTGGFDNTGLGFQALSQNLGGTYFDYYGDIEPQGARNTACGSHALALNTTGWENAAAGFLALDSNTTGWENTAFGACALQCIANGEGNTAIGWGSMSNAKRVGSQGNWNTGVGVDVLSVNTADGNTAIGTDALTSNTTGSSNTALGEWTLGYNTTGADNTASGYQALFSNKTESDNTADGYQALYGNTTGTGNTANGFQALYSNTSRSGNTASGYQALYSNTGAANTASGYEALYNNTTAFYNTAVGDQALYSDTTGHSNTAIGDFALWSNSSASYNVSCGNYALFSNTTGDNNTADGYEALDSNTAGSNNTAIGYGALLNNSSGNYNTACGDSALLSNTTGSDNTAIGYGAGQDDWTGVKNTFVGYNSNVLSTGLTNASAIGNGALVFASNTIQLGNSSVTNVSTYGSLSITSAGQGLQIQGGANAKIGIATLSSGTVTVSTTAVTTHSVIFLTEQPTVSNPGAVYVSTITAGTSFVITSTSGTDASPVAWMIVEKN